MAPFRTSVRYTPTFLLGGSWLHNPEQTTQSAKGLCVRVSRTFLHNSEALTLKRRVAQKTKPRTLCCTNRVRMGCEVCESETVSPISGARYPPHRQGSLGLSNLTIVGITKALQPTDVPVLPDCRSGGCKYGSRPYLRFSQHVPKDCSKKCCLRHSVPFCISQWQPFTMNSGELRGVHTGRSRTVIMQCFLAGVCEGFRTKLRVAYAQASHRPEAEGSGMGHRSFFSRHVA